MNNNLLISFVFLCGLCTIFNILSQTDKQTERLNLSGISGGIENRTVLDEATIGLYYQLDYMIKKEGILQKESDTLFLALGSTQSVFFDPK